MNGIREDDCESIGTTKIGVVQSSKKNGTK